ncbi:multiple RNA-binding domain-containing protein 1 [Scheffersomyces coipomensis]|uniref:multiple RNA-binding domain-containing protein 1 n=1 Tax=Scheffersomyces coipomensis TaxID=1788519 RepID=UPI00315CB752
MSRLIVRGLPQYLTEDKLKDHFSKQGNVTDVKLMKKRNGESRRFAFIGYRSMDDAEKAVRFFNKSFIDTSRIDVELAKTFSDPNVPLSFKEKRKLDEIRLREQEERLVQEEEDRKTKRTKTHKSTLADEIDKNEKLKEFIEVMKPSSQVKSWANDTIADGKGGPSAKDLEEALARQDGGIESSTITDSAFETAKAVEAESDDEYEAFGKNGDDEASDDEQMVSLKDLETDSKEVQEPSIHNDANASDLDWLKSRRVYMRDNAENQGKSVEEEAKEETSSKVIQKKEKSSTPIVEETSEEKISKKISETGRLFIRNISYESTEQDFRGLFEKYGDLEEVHIAIDTRTGKSKGFVYVQFSNNDDALSAYNSLDKEIFQGRLLHILGADNKKDHRMDEFQLKNLPLKKQRELKRKDQASKSQFSWNSLYMNTDAVLDSVASSMGISKSQLIDPQNSNSAVKQALAEAHVIGNVRKFFEERGIDLTSFDKKERDDKIILIKNFPFGTTVEEIGEMFSQYGQLKRIIMPPSGTIAIVEFRDIPNARSAFTKLAYRRFKKSILYLEKGPKELFIREPTENESVGSEVTTEKPAVEAKVTAKDIMETSATNEEENDETTTDGPTVSVFVKNLNFTSTSQQLTEVFASLPGFVVATVKTKPDPKNAGGVLSMGFGFVEFKTKEQANIAISTLDGNVLDGHKLQLKLSNRQSSTNNSSKVDKAKKSTKIIIKNLPFEASRKDLLELFGAFGQLKSCRVPKKFDKSARGFAFVEFNLLKEAENAIDQLSGVHLLGRRLVMQYAEQESDDVEAEIEKMTKKARKQMATRDIAAARLSGKGKIDLEGKEDQDFESLT